MKTFMLSIVTVLILLVPARSMALSEAWERKAFNELSETRNAVTWSRWKQLKQFEKEALYETRYIERVDPKQALILSQRPKAIIISVDGADYYKRQRILPSINIPYSKFSKFFVEKNINWFANYDFIILYCR